MIPLTTWAWVLAGLAVVDVLVLTTGAGLLAWRYHKRYRPMMQLADAVVGGDLDKARFLLAAVRGEGSTNLDTMARPSLQSGSPDTARDRFILAYLASYPTTSLGTKLLITVACGGAALLPFLIGAAGRADAVTTAVVLGLTPPEAALTLYQVGIAETAAAGSLAWALILIAHRTDPGAPSVRRRIVSRLKKASKLPTAS